jgi:hypothetical protein
MKQKSLYLLKLIIALTFSNFKNHQMMCIYGKHFKSNVNFSYDVAIKVINIISKIFGFDQEIENSIQKKKKQKQGE